MLFYPKRQRKRRSSGEVVALQQAKQLLEPTRLRVAIHGHTAEDSVHGQQVENRKQKNVLVVVLRGKSAGLSIFCAV